MLVYQSAKTGSTPEIAMNSPTVRARHPYFSAIISYWKGRMPRVIMKHLVADRTFLIKACYPLDLSRTTRFFIFFDPRSGAETWKSRLSL